jgi:uncharacterized protein DUF6636
VKALLSSAMLVAFMSSIVPAAAQSLEYFRTPSKNVYCLYASRGGPGPYLRCDVRSLNDVGFSLDRQHKATRHRITDSVYDQHAQVLRYGTARRFGPFRCTSRKSGLTCRSTSSGHGFALSRERQRLF